MFKVSTRHKIITSRQILVFEVSKRPSLHKYSHQVKLSRFGLVSLFMAGIMDFKMSISQPFEELQGRILDISLIPPNLLQGPIFISIGLACLLVVAILDFQMSIYQSFEELQG